MRHSKRYAYDNKIVRKLELKKMAKGVIILYVCVCVCVCVRACVCVCVLCQWVT